MDQLLSFCYNNINDAGIGRSKYTARRKVRAIMVKIGRNDPCPCGSGKKYKKCCLEKAEFEFTGQGFLNHLKNFMTYEEVDKMDTPTIIQRLKEIGVSFERDNFLKDIQKFYSAEQIKERWLKIHRITAKGREEDLLFLAAWVLWDRLAPPHMLSMEKISGMMDQGYNYASEEIPGKACDIWLDVWEALKFRFIPEHKNLDYLDAQYRGSFFIKNFCQDLQDELQTAGLRNGTYFEKAINYYREFLRYFPEEDELIIHNMRRALGDSYASLNRYEEADHEYEGLVQDYPDNFWGYIGWGDIYFLDQGKNLSKAKKLYEKALALAKGEDVDVVRERLGDLEKRMKDKN